MAATHEVISSEDQKDEADDILQKPVVNKTSVKMCLSSSTARIPYIKSHSVVDVLEKYPCFKEADLVRYGFKIEFKGCLKSLPFFNIVFWWLQLIYEYCLRIPLPLRILEENFKNSLLPLSHILDWTESLEDELSKITLYHKIEKFYSGGETHVPSIQFCDVGKRLAYYCIN